MRCRTIGTAATRIAQLAELIDRSEVIGLLFRMLDRRQMVDQRTCRHDLSGWARNSATDTICQFLRVTATIAKLLPEGWDCTVRFASSALAAPNMQRCDLGEGLAISPRNGELPFFYLPLASVLFQLETHQQKYTKANKSQNAKIALTSGQVRRTVIVGELSLLPG